MSRNMTVEKVTNLVSPVVEKLGFELVDVELIKEGAYFYLRVYIDKEGGVTIDECSDVSRILDKIIDDNGITKHDFFEVSSPGAERVLKKEKDFEKYKGTYVCVNLFANKDGSKKFEGELIGKENNNVVINSNDKLLYFDEKEIAMVKTVLRF